MAARDHLGNLVPTVWSAEDQFGSNRRGDYGTQVSLEVVDRDSQGFKTPYRHVRLHLKGKAGDVEFLFNAAEGGQFATEMLIFARECSRVVPVSLPPSMTEAPPSVPLPSTAPEPKRARAHK